MLKGRSEAKQQRHLDEANALAGRLAQNQGSAILPSIAFVAACADSDRKTAARQGAPPPPPCNHESTRKERGQSPAAHWLNLVHVSVPSETLHVLGVGIVPSRLVLHGPTGQVLQWWDGTHGRVLKGNHGRSRENGSHDLLAALIELL